jgi:hypothetical protein
MEPTALEALATAHGWAATVAVSGLDDAAQLHGYRDGLRAQAFLSQLPDGSWSVLYLTDTRRPTDISEDRWPTCGVDGRPDYCMASYDPTVLAMTTKQLHAGIDEAQVIRESRHRAREGEHNAWRQWKWPSSAACQLPRTLMPLALDLES